MNNIKPIETKYKGYRFRSRLEARWAVFFDAMEISWEYESEGFELSNGTYYLPDFYLPEQDLWIEIKPKGEPSDDEFHKMLLFCGNVEVKDEDGWSCWVDGDESRNMVILCGTPGRIEDCYPIQENSYNGYVGGDFDYYWCECPSCHSVGIQFNGRSARNKHKSDCPVLTSNSDKNYNHDSARLISAYEKARSARFEHGENGT